MLHEADGSSTAFRYAGDLPDSQDYTDFPDLVVMLNEEFTLLGAVETYVEAMFDAMPPAEEFY